MAFLDIHILQAVPPSNINRDASGSPKSAVFGGIKRARVSSQSWKRAARKAFEALPEAEGEKALRTRRLPQVIGDRLALRCPALREHADAIGMAAATSMFSVKKTERKKKPAKGATEDAAAAPVRPESSYLLFLGDVQIDRVVEALAGAEAELAAAVASTSDKALPAAVANVGLVELGVTRHPGSVALFGRMVADAPETGVDAACQVAHALSTHGVVTEFDYFTAVDDEVESRNADREAGEQGAGAGMIGSIEFNSAVLYRYSTVDLRTLQANLDGDVKRTVAVADGFARAFAQSMPTGKSNTFANHTRPSVVLFALREDRPVNFVGAFEKPVQASGGSGLLARSAEELFAHMAEEEDMWGSAPSRLIAVYPASLPGRISSERGSALPDRHTWSEATKLLGMHLFEAVAELKE
jgi:CRISPR system Cascade subunit CasC